MDINDTNLSLSDLDRLAGLPPLPPKMEEEYPLPAWHRSVYHKPLKNFSVEDLVKACREKLHPEQVIALVIERLTREPLVGEYYDGELLVSLCSVGSGYWKTHVEQTAVMKMLLTRRKDLFPDDLRMDIDTLHRRLNGEF